MNLPKPKKVKLINEKRFVANAIKIQNDMKKISNNMSVQKSSTLAGQRELLREHTNKINEIIDVLEKNPRLVYVVEEKPREWITQCEYTAQASTGCKCSCHPTEYEKYGYSCQKCWGIHEAGATGEPPYGAYPVKPQENLREKIFDMLSEELNTDIAGGLADDIYALINK